MMIILALFCFALNWLKLMESQIHTKIDCHGGKYTVKLGALKPLCNLSIHLL